MSLQGTQRAGGAGDQTATDMIWHRSIAWTALQRGCLSGWVIALFLSGGCRAKGNESTARSAGGWKVGRNPAVVIGAAGSSGQGSLYFVTGAAMLSDGRIVVTDGGWGRSRVSVFSRAGRFVSVIGGTGEGPGEFQGTWGVQAGPNDSSFVWDQALQRLTVFSRDGRVARMANLRVAGSLLGTEGLNGILRLADGTWVGDQYQAMVPTPPGEIRRDTMAIGLLDGALNDFRPIAHLPGRMTTETANATAPPPFSPEVVDATWGRCVFVSSGETRSVDVYSSGGKLLRTIQGPGQARPVTQADLDTLLAYRLRRVTSGRGSTFVHQWVREAGRTDSVPYYHQIVADEWGQLWLEKYEPPVGMGTLWYVVSQSGEEVGTVRLPAVMWVYSITRKGVLGQTRGRLDEERVELFPFVATPPDHPQPLPECAPSR